MKEKGKRIVKIKINSPPLNYSHWEGLFTRTNFTAGVYPYEAKNVPDGYTYEMIAKEHIVDSGIKVNGTKGFANKEMLKRWTLSCEQRMSRRSKPVRIADNDFTFDFENVPAGEYTLIFTYPAGFVSPYAKLGAICLMITQMLEQKLT